MIALLLSLACAPSSLTTQETWELLGIDRNGALIDMRWTAGNTGLLRGSGRSRVAYLSPRNIPLEYGRAGAPEEVSHPPEGGLVIGPDEVVPSADGHAWTFRTRGDDFSMRLSLVPSGPPASPLVMQQDGTWMVEAPVTRGALQGFLTTGRRQELVDADALLLRRSGDAPPALRGTQRMGVYVIAPDLSVGIDQTGAEALSWVLVGDRMWAHEPGLLTRHEDGGFVMDFRPSADLVVRVIPVRQPRLASDPVDHLLAPERWLLQRVAGLPVRRVRAARAELTVAGVRRTAPALSVVVSYE
ncbi:MAG: hypothetical protein H6741_34610 [Alphaproteobacteria bacterium]|nr:hypothetical protein [Alphaproteobacteria bacterium]